MTGDVEIRLGGARMRAYPFVVFPGLDWARMAIAADELGDLADDVDAFVDRVLAYSRPEDPQPAVTVAVAA